MWKKKKVRREKEKKKNPTVPQCRSVRQSLRLNSKQLEPPLPAWPSGGLLSTAAGMAEGGGRGTEADMAAPEGRDGGRGSISKLADLLAKLSWFQAQGRGDGSRWPSLRPNPEQMFLARQRLRTHPELNR